MSPSTRRPTLTHFIFIGMAVGVLMGFLFPDSARAEHRGWAASDLKILSDLFVRGIKMIIGPILFSTLVMGIAGHGDDLKKVGRLAFRSILYFELVTTLTAVAANVVAQGNSDTIGCHITVNGQVREEHSVDGYDAQTSCLVKSA